MEVTRKIIYQVPEVLSVKHSALIAKIANSSHSRVTIEYKGSIYTAHSILKLLSIDIGKGDLVVISARGKDAEETVKNIGELLMEDVSDYVYSDNCQTSFI